MADPTANDVMNAYALDAVDYAERTFGIRLDFSPESIRSAEQIAGKLFDARPKGVTKLFRKEPPPEAVRQFSMLLGAYVGEVFRRAKGGDWFLHETMQSYAVGTPEKYIFPVAKAFKRLTNGDEDSLWFFYQVVTTR